MDWVCLSDKNEIKYSKKEKMPAKFVWTLCIIGFLRANKNLHTGYQLSSGTPVFPHLSRMALISIGCYISLEEFIPALQNEVLFVLKTSLVFAQQLIS